MTNKDIWKAFSLLMSDVYDDLFGTHGSEEKRVYSLGYINGMYDMAHALIDYLDLEEKE